MHHIRLFLLGDEVASPVLGQAGLHQGPDLREFAIGVELLQLRSQASALGRGVAAEMRTDDCQSLSFLETETTNREMAIKNNIIASIKFGALIR